MKTRHLEKTMKSGLNKNDNQKKGRKYRKQADEEINDYFKEFGKESSYSHNQYNTFSSQQQRLYGNYRYLTNYEKQQIDEKFTKPKNKSQTLYNNLLKNKNKKIIVVTGPAGTGKTLFATEYGIKNFIQEHYEKIIFTRPSVSVDEDLGYLPGTLEEKMAPWVRPIYDVLYNFMTVKEVSELVEEKIIEIAPLGYMRGRTFKNSWIIADEMQNSTINQMKMLMTRIGENSRLIITGDLEQTDKVGDNLNGMEDFLNKFKGKRSSSISSFEFQNDDIQREEVVKEILEIYDSECIPPAYNIDFNDGDDDNDNNNENDGDANPGITQELSNEGNDIFAPVYEIIVDISNDDVSEPTLDDISDKNTEGSD